MGATLLDEAEEKELWIYPHGDPEEKPERWMRSGACHQCGACCELHWIFAYSAAGARSEESPPIPSGPPNPNPGFSSSAMVAERWEGYWRFWQRADVEVSEVPCSSYEGEGFCNKHEDPARPEICRKWPVMPSDLEKIPNCGFFFERMDHG